MTEDSRRRTYIPWGRLVAESAAIVISILLAFAIDAWWDDRQEAAEAHETVLSLKEEFLDHRSALERRKEVWQEYSASIERLLQAVRSTNPPPVATMDALLRHATYMGTWDPSSGARDALIASRRLELIDNVELRALLAAWQGVVDEVRDNQLVARDMIVTFLNPYLARRGVIPRVKAVWQEWPGPLMPDSEAERAYGDILADPEFEGMVANRYALLDVDGFSDAVDFVDTVLEWVEVELQRY
jgi:hypothetical protein